ncbi:MAG: hypothetical protein R2834_04180 [Rhodothermales bacterium]
MPISAVALAEPWKTSSNSNGSERMCGTSSMIAAIVLQRASDERMVGGRRSAGR